MYHPILIAEQFVEFLAGVLEDTFGAIRNLANQAFVDPDPFMCGLDGCKAGVFVI